MTGPGACFLAVMLVIAAPMAAQDGAQDGAQNRTPTTAVIPPVSIILTLDQDRLFLESAFGKASLARERAATGALEEENSRIEAELVVEEQELTHRRGSLPTDEFAALAVAFDQKVERIREEQDAKARDLSRARDRDRQIFLRAVIPALGEVMAETGAVAILDKSMIILSLSAIDITDEAITRVDAALGPGLVGPETP